MKWFFLLCSFSCFGQLPVIPWTVPQVSSGGGDLLNSVVNWAYLWVSRDLTNNVTVTNWTDRIQGIIATQPDSTKRNTNSVKGVRLGLGDNATSVAWNLTNKLQNITPEGSSVITNMIVAIILWYDGPDAFSCQNIADDYQNGHDSNNGGAVFISHADFDNVFSNGKYTSTSWGPNGSVSTVPTGRFYDAIIQSPTNGQSCVLYTNGVVATLSGNAATALFTNISCIGATNAGITFHPMPGWLGVLGIGTNSVLTSLNVSNFHWYRTNFYGGSP